MPARCAIPSDSSDSLRRAASASPTASSRSSTRSSGAADPAATMRRCARRRWLGWPATPPRTAPTTVPGAPHSFSGRPRKRVRPSPLIRPSMSWIVVVFPAPFAPTKPVTWPARRVREMSSRTRSGPKDRPRPTVSTSTSPLSTACFLRMVCGRTPGHLDAWTNPQGQGPGAGTKRPQYSDRFDSGRIYLRYRKGEEGSRGRSEQAWKPKYPHADFFPRLLFPQYTVLYMRALCDPHLITHESDQLPGQNGMRENAHTPYSGSAHPVTEYRHPPDRHQKSGHGEQSPGNNHPWGGRFHKEPNRSHGRKSQKRQGPCAFGGGTGSAGVGHLVTPCFHVAAYWRRPGSPPLCTGTETPASADHSGVTGTPTPRHHQWRALQISRSVSPGTQPRAGPWRTRAGRRTTS